MRVKSNNFSKSLFLLFWHKSISHFAKISFHFFLLADIFFVSGIALLLLKFFFCFWLLALFKKGWDLEEGTYLHSLLVNWFGVTSLLNISQRELSPAHWNTLYWVLRWVQRCTGISDIMSNVFHIPFKLFM